MCGLREVVNLCTTHSDLHNPFHFFFYLPTFSPCPSRLAHPLPNPQVISLPYHHSPEYTHMCPRGVLFVACELFSSSLNESNYPPIPHTPGRKNPPRYGVDKGQPKISNTIPKKRKEAVVKAAPPLPLLPFPFLFPFLLSLFLPSLFLPSLSLLSLSLLPSLSLLSISLLPSLLLLSPSLLALSLTSLYLPL